MTVRKHFFENYRGGHDLWADMTSENTVFINVNVSDDLNLLISSFWDGYVIIIQMPKSLMKYIMKQI